MPRCLQINKHDRDKKESDIFLEAMQTHVTSSEGGRQN